MAAGRRRNERALSAGTAWVLGLLVVLSVVLLIEGCRFLGDWPPKERVQPQEQSAQGASEALEGRDVDVGRARALDRHELAGDEQTQTRENEQHLPDVEERPLDVRALDAQEGVWRVSYALAVVAAIQVALSGIGLYLLRSTLLATRDTLEQTREASEAAMRTVANAQICERAYVYARFEMNEVSDDDVGLDIVFQNVGRTPARDLVVSVFWETTSEHGKVEGIAIARDVAIGPVGAGEKRAAGEIVMSMNTEDEVLFLEDGDCIAVRWSYRSVFSEDRIEEYACKDAKVDIVHPPEGYPRQARPAKTYCRLDDAVRRIDIDERIRSIEADERRKQGQQ